MAEEADENQKARAELMRELNQALMVTLEPVVLLMDKTFAPVIHGGAELRLNDGREISYGYTIILAHPERFEELQHDLLVLGNKYGGASETYIHKVDNEPDSSGG